MKIQILIDYEIAHLVFAALEDRIYILECNLKKSQDPNTSRFYDKTETIVSQLHSLREVLKQITP